MYIYHLKHDLLMITIVRNFYSTEVLLGTVALISTDVISYIFI